MDFHFSPQEEAFRQEVRSWLAANMPPATFRCTGIRCCRLSRQLKSTCNSRSVWMNSGSIRSPGFKLGTNAPANPKLIRAVAPDVFNPSAASRAASAPIPESHIAPFSPSLISLLNGRRRGVMHRASTRIAVIIPTPLTQVLSRSTHGIWLKPTRGSISYTRST